ncbi:MAG: hypothetical protein ACLTYN_03505 [Dysosmobacter welbionis]
MDRYEAAWTRLEDFNRRFPEDMKKTILQHAIQGKLVDSAQRRAPPRNCMSRSRRRNGGSSKREDQEESPCRRSQRTKYPLRSRRVGCG